MANAPFKLKGRLIAPGNLTQTFLDLPASSEDFKATPFSFFHDFD